MGKKTCPIGLICFDTKYIIFLFIIIILFFVYYIHTQNKNNLTSPFYSPNNKKSIINDVDNGEEENYNTNICVECWSDSSGHALCLHHQGFCRLAEEPEADDGGAVAPCLVPAFLLLRLPTRLLPSDLPEALRGGWEAR